MNKQIVLLHCFLLMMAISVAGCSRHERDQASSAPTESTKSPKGQSSQSSHPQSARHYWLLVSKPVDDDDFDNDKVLVIGCGSTDGLLTIYANDSPIKLLVKGGWFRQIDFWLQPGTNTIAVHG